MRKQDLMLKYSLRSCVIQIVNVLRPDVFPAKLRDLGKFTFGSNLIEF